MKNQERDSIQVSIRIKPHFEEGKTCVHIDPNLKNTVIIEGLNQQEQKFFSFDNVASSESTQEDIFEMIGQQQAQNCIEGYNGCVFVYGQTGSGKTYTMTGTPQQPGLLPRLIDYLFKCIFEDQTQDPSVEYLVKCSHLEIYNEHIIDLLNPELGNLQLREDLNKGVYVEFLTEEYCTNLVDAMEVVQRGNENRHISSTQMNIESSRSHSVFTIQLESRRQSHSLTNHRFSRFHFVDLAGSERQKQTQVSGDRLREGCQINRSLHILGNVINALVEDKEQNRYVHYRDSKLTFLLKDSLGGNSRTHLIANIQQSNLFYQETLSTLMFSKRVKQVKNKARINEDESGSLESLKNEIKRLKQELAKWIVGLKNTQIDSPDKKKKDTLIQNVNFEDITASDQRYIKMEEILKVYLEQSTESETALFLEIEKYLSGIKELRTAYSLSSQLEQQLKLIIKLQNEQIIRLRTQNGDENIQPDYQQELSKALLCQAAVMKQFSDGLRHNEISEKIVEKAKLQINENVQLLNNIVSTVNGSLEERRKFQKQIDQQFTQIYVPIEQFTELQNEQTILTQEYTQQKEKDNQIQQTLQHYGISINQNEQGQYIINNIQEQALQDLNQELNQLNNEKQLLNNDLQNIQIKLEQTINENQELQNKIINLNQQQQQQQQIIQQQNQEKESQQQIFLELQQKLLNQELTFQNEIQKLQEIKELQITQYEQQIQQLQQINNSEIIQQQTIFDEKIHKLIEELEFYKQSQVENTQQQQILQNQLNEVTQQMNQENLQKNQLQIQYKQLENTLNEERNHYAIQLDERDLDLQSLNEEIIKNEELIKKKEEIVNTFKIQIEEKDNLLQNSTQQIIELQDKQKNQQCEIVSLQQQLQQLNNQLEEQQEQEIIELKECNVKIQEDKEQIEIELRNQNEQIQKQLEQSLNQKQQFEENKNNELQLLKQSFEEQIQDQNQEIQELQTQLQQQNDDFQDQQNLLFNLITTKDKEISKCQEDLENYATRLQEASKVIEKYSDCNSDLKGTINQLHNQLDSQQQLIAELQMKTQDEIKQHQELNELKKQYSKVLNDQKQQKQEVEENKIWVLHFKEENEKLINQVTQIQEQNQKLQNENNHLRKEIKENKQNLQIIQQQFQDKIIESNEEMILQLQEAKLETQIIQKEKLTLQNQIDNLADELNKCQQEIEELRIKHKKLQEIHQDDVINLNQQIKIIKDDLDQSRKIQMEMKKQEQEYKEQNINLNQQLEKLSINNKNDINILKQQFDITIIDVQKKDEQINKLQEQIKYKQQQLESQTSFLNSVEQNKLSQTNQILQQSTQLTNLSRELFSIKQQMQINETQCESYKKEIDRLKKELEFQTKQYNEQKQQNQISELLKPKSKEIIQTTPSPLKYAFYSNESKTQQSQKKIFQRTPIKETGTSSTTVMKLNSSFTLNCDSEIKHYKANIQQKQQIIEQLEQALIQSELTLKEVHEKANEFCQKQEEEIKKIKDQYQKLEQEHNQILAEREYENQEINKQKEQALFKVQILQDEVLKSKRSSAGSQHINYKSDLSLRETPPSHRYRQSEGSFNISTQSKLIYDTQKLLLENQKLNGQMCQLYQILGLERNYKSRLNDGDKIIQSVQLLLQELIDCKQEIKNLLSVQPPKLMEVQQTKLKYYPIEKSPKFWNGQNETPKATFFNYSK